jgi:ribosomal protein S18 acetylase RimI-like enzyme
LVAAVRVGLSDRIAALGRTAVAPDLQGRGLGTSLLTAVEQLLPSTIEAIELFTGEHSERNLRLYRRLGYCETHRTPVGAYALVHLRKSLARDGR